MEKEKKGSWIINTGASNHICTYHPLFDNLITLTTPITVHLPNGNTNHVSQIGNVQLNGLKLSEALFLPKFSHNLLFVNRLITNNSISCTFYHCFFFVLQDQKNKRMLAVGRVVANLYCLDHFSFLPNVLESFNTPEIFTRYIADSYNLFFSLYSSLYYFCGQ